MSVHILHTYSTENADRDKRLARITVLLRMN
jgi:hypothetical protein